jgi:hypothetical protein
MQHFNSLHYSQFRALARLGSVAVTVEPRLAHKVMRTRLVPAKFKRALLSSANETSTSVLIACARESELFYDIMVELGVLAVHETAAYVVEAGGVNRQSAASWQFDIEQLELES